ncbi:hypothetical protein MASR2M74_24040 [Paracoccaceae bacterium]
MPDLATALRDLLPEGVALGLPVAGDLPMEHPGPAIATRRAEFAAGRAAARAAMAALGLPPAPIPMGEDRAPVWPLGVTGSISHCTGACLAVAGMADHWCGLGVDVEPLAPLDPSLWPVILCPTEGQGGLLALRSFVAKEAAYKAQYPLSRTVFDFHTLRLDWQGDFFTARFTRPVAPFWPGAVLQGQLVQAGGFLAAFVAVTA